MQMRFFFAGLATETNTFAPFPTGRAGFAAGGLFLRDASRVGDGVPRYFAQCARALIEGAGHELVESLFAFAQPSGRTLASVYAELRDALLADLAAQPVDAVLLVLHGAMVATDCDDCEGDILARVRAIVGSAVPIGAMIDPHCHFTAAMRDHADVIIAMKEYPHTDGPERLAELCRLLAATARGEIHPVTQVFDCRMIGFYPTMSEPMAGFVRRLQAAEQIPGVLSVSLGHGFPWADVADVGTKVWVVADRDAALAMRVAEQIGREFYTLRESLTTNHLTIDTAIDVAIDTGLAAHGLTVLADASDNAGGGAPSDNTAILRRLIERGVAHVALGCLWDPVAVATCFEAGIGASFDLRIGGKAGVSSGQPIDARITVRGLVRDFRHASFLGEQPMGDAAWIGIGTLDLVLISNRVQTFAPQAFEGMGLSLTDKRVVVVKSSEHFRAAFEPLAARIVHVAAGGAMSMDFARLPYTRRDVNWWPRVVDPLSSKN